MARWFGSRLAICVASASVVAGCFLGGQTGTADGTASTPSCEPPPSFPANQPVADGVTPAEFARQFEGEHTATLRWSGATPGDAGAPIADAVITVDVVYEGGDGAGCGDLEVGVLVTITTSDGLVHESGPATLIGHAGTLYFATLTFRGAGASVSGALLRSGDGSVDLSGSLQLIAGNVPGDRATFPAPSTAGSGSGGSSGTP